MPDGPVRQNAWNAVYSGQSKTCKVTLDRPTLPNAVIVVIASATVPGSGTFTLTGPVGFGSPVRERTANELKFAVWVREGSPSMTSVSVSTSAGRSLQVEVLELAGVRPTGSLDKVTIQAVARSSDRPDTGSSGTIAQADEVVVAAVANRYSSTSQLGFIGGLARLAERTTSTQDPDDRRSRLTVHAVTTTAITSFRLSGRLTSARDWVAILLTFRGASSGPVLVSARPRSVLRTGAGTVRMRIEGPIQARNPGPALVTGGGSAWIGPSDYQHLVGGRGGLLIGEGTPYPIASIEGLEGPGDLRISDRDLALSDGSSRGVDLQSARLVEVRLATPGGTRAEVEQRLDVLKRALVPQRDLDLEWIWRHPGQPLRMIRCRPISLRRDMTLEQVITGRQPFALRAADPRIYGTTEHRVVVAVTPAGQLVPVVTQVINVGSAAAHPLITVRNPVGAETVTRVALVNPGQDVAFDVRAVLPAGSTLIGDMEARATRAPRSTVTVDGRGKYGAWQHPREAFRLGPGVNELHLITEPAGAPVAVDVRYRDTSSG